MKQFLILVFCVFTFNAWSQKEAFSITKFKLPAAIEYYNNQFSGLYVHENNLLFMSESRLQDNAEAILYSINLADIDRQILDSNFKLPYKKIPIINLNFLRNKMALKGDDYEGLEAITILNKQVYFSVETATPSNNCYLLRGNFVDTTLVLDKLFLLPTPKPIDATGKHVYNAGYEAITSINKTIFNLFEYNSFTKKNNFAIGIIPQSYTNVLYSKNKVQELPFRITDITKTGKNSFLAINYFYKGDGDDAVYRVSKKDKENDLLIRDEWGYNSYCRVINMTYKKGKFAWKKYWELPKEYMAYNWEGIAAYKNGFFLMNDKYTAARPYYSTLLFVKPK